MIAIRFLIGSLLGYGLEKSFAPQLKGAIPALPIRPIYGVGFAAASKRWDVNLVLSMALEQLTWLASTRELWHYDDDDPLVFSPAVKIVNNVAFATMMSEARSAADLLEIR